VVSWYALNVGRVVGDKITRRHNDPCKKGDRGSSVVYNELMQAWVIYELVQVLHIYGLTPMVRSNLGSYSDSLSKIASYLRDKTKLDSDSKGKVEKMIQKLFAETEHSAMFKQMQFGSMSHFKQMTTYAIPFLMITWLRQLEEFFFLKTDQDFFDHGMYSALSAKPKKSTTNNNIWMSKNASKKNLHKVETLAFLKPKMRQNAGVCVTLREWAAYIFKCEFEPQTLDESSKKILKSTQIKKKKYEMKDNDLNWATLFEDEDKDSKKTPTSINVKDMKDKELFLNVCEALQTGGRNTKTNREKVKNADAVKSMVEIIVRKWDWDIDNFKDAMKKLAIPDMTSKENEDRSDDENNTVHLSGDGNSRDGSESSSSGGESDSSSEGDDNDLDDSDNDSCKSNNQKKLDEDNSDKLNKEDEGIPNDTNALDENKKDEKEGNDDESDE